MSQTSPGHIARSIALCFSLFFFPLVCSAQRTTRSLTGTVTDGHHEPLKGAVIEVQNGNTTGIISYITGANGRYSFRRLDGETDYRLWASFRGRHSKVRNLNQFDSDKPAVIDFVLKPQN